MKNFFFLVLGLIFILGSIFLFFQKNIVRENKFKLIIINGTNIKVEMVDTPEKRERGLSGRENLAEGAGMFFVFDSPGQYGFWMKDMNFAIDIVWIDENYKIVDVEKNVSPKTFPQVFHPDQRVKYVLELQSGAVDKYQIATGTMIQL